MIKRHFFALAMLILAGCGDSNNTGGVQKDGSASRSDGDHAPELINARVYDAPLENGRFLLTASDSPATFGLSWEVKRPTSSNFYYSLTTNLFLSRNTEVDPSDLEISTFHCADYSYDDDELESDPDRCAYNEDFLCSYYVNDTIQCLGNSRDNARYINRHLRETGDWPWDGYLILEFCSSGSTNCSYSRAFPIRLNKETGNSSVGKLTLGAIQIESGKVKDSNQLVELSDIQLQGARSLDGRIVVEANSAREGFELSWNIDQGSPLYHIYLYLSSDKTLSENDIRIFRDYVGSWDEKKVVCQFSPLNDFKCNDDRSEHLSEYFSNHGDMPWEGYLLIRFGDDRSNGVYFTRAVPLRLQY